MPSDAEIVRQIGPMLDELFSRARKARLLDRYYEGNCPLPTAIVRAHVKKAYRALMPMSEAPWGSLIVDSVQDRLHVTGIADTDKATADAVWGIWQDNQMDSEALIGHNSALVSGRAYALVWPGEKGPEITLESAEQMIVSYRPGSRRHRRAALRFWEEDDGRARITLYRPDGVWKFEEALPNTRNTFTFTAAGRYWNRREVLGEDWPLPPPLPGILNVIELPINRRLKAGVYGHARGEFEHCVGLIDRINLLTFLGLVVALWMGFPLRGVVGDKILRDDNGDQLPPFESKPDSVMQFESKDAKLVSFDAADRKNLSIYAELDQLATITKTPRHYFPMEHGMSNIAADAIRASEGGLVSKVPVHHGSLGEGWEETLRVAGLMLPNPVELSPRAELQWGDYEFRSLTERADAATKLKELLPWQVIAEKVLNATSSEIARWEAMRGSDAFSALLAEATRPPVPAPEPVAA